MEGIGSWVPQGVWGGEGGMGEVGAEHRVDGGGPWMPAGLQFGVKMASCRLYRVLYKPGRWYSDARPYLDDLISKT